MQLEFGVGEAEAMGERVGCVEVKTAFALCWIIHAHKSGNPLTQFNIITRAAANRQSDSWLQSGVTEIPCKTHQDYSVITLTLCWVSYHSLSLTFLQGIQVLAQMFLPTASWLSFASFPVFIFILFLFMATFQFANSPRSIEIENLNKSCNWVVSHSLSPSHSLSLSFNLSLCLL